MRQNRLLLMSVAVLVVFVTTYLLIMPALTLEKEKALEQGGITVAEEAAAPETSDATPGTKPSATVSSPNADEEETAGASPGELEWEGDGYTIAASYDAAAALPEDTRIQAEEILEEDKDTYDAYYKQALKAVRKDAEENQPDGQNAKGKDLVADLDYAHFYDITLSADGEELEPEAPVSVSIAYNKALTVADPDHLKIIHFVEDPDTGKITAEVLDPETIDLKLKKEKMTSATFTAESFSVYAVVYTVDFEYEADGEKYAYSLEGGDSISLKNLVQALKLNTGAYLEEGATDVTMKQFVNDIADVEFSSPELVYVHHFEKTAMVRDVLKDHKLHVTYPLGLTQKEVLDLNGKEYQEGEWVLISLQPFDSEETLSITMKNGYVYTVRVTDAQDAIMNGDKVQTIANPAGTTIDLFDYWVDTANAGGRSAWPGLSESWGPHADAGGLNGSGNNAGINSSTSDAEHGHALKFVPAWEGTVYNGTKKGDSGNAWSSLNRNYKNGLNSYTGNGNPFQGIVKDTLTSGYPVLSDNEEIGTNGESLAYLFDPKTSGEHVGKASYAGVNQLMYVDKDGYYTYDSRDYAAKLNSDGKTFDVTKQTSDNTEIRGFWPFGTQNFWSGVHVNTKFSIPADGQVLNPLGEYKDMQFEFSGDDDTWLYVDGVLVGDGGGIHNRTEIDVNFAKGTVTVTGKKDPAHPGNFEETKYLDDIFKAAGKYNNEEWEDIGDGSGHERFKAGTYHTFDMFYLERGGGESNLYIHYNLVSTADFTAHKTYAGKDENERLDRDQFQFELIGFDGKYNKAGELVDASKRAIMPLAGDADGEGTVAAPKLYHDDAEKYTSLITGVTEDGNINFGMADISEKEKEAYEAGNPSVYRYMVREIVPEDAVNSDGIEWRHATVEQKAAGGFVKNEVVYDGRVFYFTAEVRKGEAIGSDGNSYPVYSLKKTRYKDSEYKEPDTETKFTNFENRYDAKYGNVEFKKTDETGADLAGAEFKLYKDAKCTVPAIDLEGTKRQWVATSGADGKVSFENVRTGTYYMKETQAPEGFVVSDTIYVVVIEDAKDKTKKSLVYALDDSDKTHLDSITNSKPGEIRVNKIWEDQNGKVIDGGNREVNVKLKRRIVSPDKITVTVTLKTSWKEDNIAGSYTKTFEVDRDSALLKWNDSGQFGWDQNRLAVTLVSPSSVSVTDKTAHGGGNPVKYELSNLSSGVDHVDLEFTYKNGPYDNNWFVNHINNGEKGMTLTPTGEMPLSAEPVEDEPFNSGNHSVALQKGSWNRTWKIGGKDSDYMDQECDYPSKTDEGRVYKYYVVETDEAGNELTPGVELSQGYSLNRYSPNNSIGVSDQGVLEVYNRIQKNEIPISVEKKWNGVADPEKNALLKNSSVVVTLGRYIVTEKTGNFAIQKSITADHGSIEENDFSAEYYISGTDASGAHREYGPYTIRGAGSVTGKIAPGEYQVTETVISANNDYFWTHSPKFANLTVTEEAGGTPSPVVFTSDATVKTGSLVIKSHLDSNQSNVDFSGVTYTVYESDGITRAKDVNGSELPVISFNEASGPGGEEINNLRVGTYVVKESSLPEVEGFAVTEHIPANGDSISVTVTDGGNPAEATFSTRYDTAVSNSTYKIGAPDAWNPNPSTMLTGLLDKLGNGPFPVGTKVMLTLAVDGNWDRIGNNEDAVTYGGKSLEKDSVEKLGGDPYKYEITFTIRKDAELRIALNGGKNEIRTLQVERVAEPANTASSRSKFKAKAAFRKAPKTSPTINYGEEPINAILNYADDTSFNGTLTLNQDEKWRNEINLPAKDENGNRYYYYIKSVTETNMPSGTICSVQLDGNSKYLVGEDVHTAQDGNPLPLTITNTVPEQSGTSITIRKVDEKDVNRDNADPLKGAGFKVTKFVDDTYQEIDNTWGTTGSKTLIDEKKDDNTYSLNGVFTFTDLQVGYYKIEETQYPKGYVKMSTDPVFQIRKKTGSDELEIVQLVQGKDGTYVEGTTPLVRVKDDTMTVVIGNTPGKPLPFTGGSGTRWIYLLGSILLILGAGGLVVRRRMRA